MDRRVHESSSSSQNDSFQILSKKGPRGALIVASPDGASFFIPKAIALQEGLSSGDILSEFRAEELKQRSEQYLCKQKIYDSLSRRDHSRKEIEQKLRLKKFRPDVYEDILNLFEEEKLIDDQRFAENFIQSRLRNHPEGATMLRQRLALKGISREIVRDVMEEYVDDLALWDACCRVGEKLSRTKEGDKLRDAMLRKGFSWGMVKAYLRGDEYL